jgi:hypothetical protein
MSIAPWLARMGTVVAIIGAFLILAVDPDLGIMVLSTGTVLACVAWGWTRIETRPGRVAIAGTALLAVGLAWMTWIYLLDSGPCPVSINCPAPWGVLTDPFFVLGEPLVAAGAITTWSAQAKWRRIRKSNALNPGMATVPH